jgi:hypothetical protein
MKREQRKMPRQFARDRRVAFADRACPDLMIDASDIAFNVTSARCIASTL